MTVLLRDNYTVLAGDNEAVQDQWNNLVPCLSFPAHSRDPITIDHRHHLGYRALV